MDRSLASVAGFMSLSTWPPCALPVEDYWTDALDGTETDRFGITANAIAPRRSTLNGARGWTNEALEKRANHLPIRRLSGTEEIARVALFLPAPESGYISGATLVVDGGWVAPGAT
jgi:NAD(P)-dependent dehydrogenase (short-subunit alcohol dehydrogenase family)